jgi:ABC-2 type transport system permease protein
MTSLRVTAGGHVRRQLTSPASWAIVGVFALLAGVAFVRNLHSFLDASAAALSSPAPSALNVNQLLIRPFLLQVGFAALLVLPVVTARAGRRAGVPDTFAGVLALYAVMLLVSFVPVAALFLFGEPAWGPILTGYLGLLLIGAAFVSIGVFVSNQAATTAAAAVATYAIALMLAAATWLTRTNAPDVPRVFGYMAAGEALDDFAKGIVDSGHVVSCLAVIALGVFLTLHSAHSDQT